MIVEFMALDAIIPAVVCLLSLILHEIGRRIHFKFSGKCATSDISCFLEQSTIDKILYN